MLFLKSTAAMACPGVYLVDVAAKPPGRTFGVFLAVDEGAPPADLLAAIEALGFQRARTSPYKHQDGKKVLDLHYTKTGSDIFGGWTVDERDANLQALDALFAASGVKIAPRIMSLAEAF